MTAASSSSVDRPETATRRPRASLITSLRATYWWRRHREHVGTILGLVLMVVGLWQMPYPWGDSAAIIMAGLSVLVFELHLKG